MKYKKRHRRSPHIWNHLLPSFIFFLALFCKFEIGVAAQCFGGVETYEKTSGTTVLCSAADGCNSRGLLTQPDTSVTRDCIAICKQSSACNVFTVDYLNSRCQSYDVDTNSKSGRKKLEKDSIVNYFEKICLKGVRQNQFDKLCNSERGWAFERVINGALEGYDHKRLEGIDTRAECARLCLMEDGFECRSAEYEFESKICILSREDRRTQPEAFRKTVGIDYIENQCVKALPDCSYTSAKQDVTVIAMDDILFSRSSSDCQRFCDDARAFNCRSYAQLEDRCYLSGDDSVNLEGVPQPVEIGAMYKEKICTRSTCDGGIFTYEKTTGHFLRTAIQDALMVEVTSPGITLECANKCSAQGSECPSFTIDYGGQRCFKLDRNTQGRGDTLAPRDGTNYFEKICLRGEISNCRDKGWAFERVPNKVLEGFDNKEITNVPSRRDCEELCLREKSFSCRSAEYNYSSLDCTLSRESRRTRPGAFRDSKNVDYLENGCIQTSDLDCSYQRTDNAYPRYLDTIVDNINDEVACEVQCTFYEQFVCRAFSYYASANQCFISGDDRASAQEGALQNRPGTDYFERSCDPTLSPKSSGTTLSESLTASTPDGVTAAGFTGIDPSRTFAPQANVEKFVEPRSLVPERRCANGKLAYEKTTGFELIRANPTRLFTSKDGGIIADCASRCEADTRCKGFNMDYNRNECQAVTKNSDNNLFNLRTSSGVSYFEAICLQGRSCGALWTFERFIDMELKGHVRETLTDVTKTECEDRCLGESRFKCRSASYDHLRQECYLSEEDRFTQSKSFVAKQGTDYLENQCESKQTKCDFAPQTTNQYLVYTDKVIDAYSDATCRTGCAQERDFNCRSYSFLSESRPGSVQCLLSGDNQLSAGRNAFQLSSGAIYSERDCSRTATGNDFVPDDDLGEYTTSKSTAFKPKAKPQTSSGNGARPTDSDNSIDFGLTGTGRGRDTVKTRPREQDAAASSDPGRCKEDNLESTYEKVLDFTYDRGSKEQIEIPQDIGLINYCTEECSNRGGDCLAVTLQNERGGRQRCYSHSSSSSVDDRDLTAATGVTYFEKICVQKTCRKSWTFTRVPQFEFIGDANEEVSDVKTIGECRNLCLQASLYQCRSATYDSNAKVCRLTEETRRSAPSDFRPADRGVDYLENECADVPSNCEYVDQPGTYLPFTDTYLPKINDIEECRSQCTVQTKYNCRSFNFNAFRKECFLSSDDSISLPSGLHQDRDFTFSERGGCNSGTGQNGLRVRVECTPSDMLVTLNLARDFRGRIYATGNPQACFELGTGQSEMTLRIPLGSQCGTVQQNRGRYVNHVVIQENPVIMQDTDKTVRVECAFTAEDQTVSFRPTAGPDGRQEGGSGGISVTVPFQPTGTNIVTNTAPTPGVRMRVVRRNGETATMVGLGEDLQLRIEIDQESAFGLFARKLEARTDNGELMNLVDDTGCPVNELIFPALQLEDGTRALYADFKAFRFPSTPIVNFIATVQFCQELCEPMDCIGNLQSYGRRRRASEGVRRNVTEVTTRAYFGGEDDDYEEFIVTPDPSALKVTKKKRSADLLPEHIDLGLRLTVGEDVLQKPFLQSKHGDGHFPEMSPRTEPAPSSYYPAGGPDFNDPSYVCSPQSTIIASVIIVIVLNIGLIAAFVVFYRLKRKQWSKRSASVSPASSSHLLTITGAPNTSRVYPSVAPPVPTRPKTASGSLGGGNFLTGPPPIHNSGSSPNVIYKRPGEVSSAGSNGSRQRFSGLSASSLASLPRD